MMIIKMLIMMIVRQKHACFCCFILTCFYEILFFCAGLYTHPSFNSFIHSLVCPLVRSPVRSFIHSVSQPASHSCACRCCCCYAPHTQCHLILAVVCNHWLFRFDILMWKCVCECVCVYVRTYVHENVQILFRQWLTEGGF